MAESGSLGRLHQRQVLGKAVDAAGLDVVPVVGDELLAAGARVEHQRLAGPVIQGLREIAADYDALIVDLWGVIHGGIEPYPGVVDALAALQAQGLPVALLSNAPRRAATAPE